LPARKILPLALFLALALACLALASASSARKPKIASKAVTFTVQNTNRSKLGCGSDGATYAVKGHLVGPASKLARSSRRSKRAVTLYVHGLGFGEWFWNFAPVPGYNFATAEAKAGHVSVVIDRLGYDASAHPEGFSVCLGSQADVAHQIVGQLRSGGYTVDGGTAVRFKKVALAGHSAGGEIANVEAYSFKDVDALVVMSFSYSNLPRAQIAFGPTRDKCLAHGEPAEPGLPSGYAYFGTGTPEDFEAVMFHSATQAVRDAAAPLRNRDPCGDDNAIIPALLQQQANVKKIKVPVLVICGTRDALYSALGCRGQAERYTRARKVSVALVRGAGHALTLERQAPTFRRKLGRWLKRRGF
jgi:pimeloyl-ACP methyl ester carboxylesterase